MTNKELLEHLEELRANAKEFIPLEDVILQELKRMTKKRK